MSVTATPVDQYIKTPGTFYKNAYQATKNTARNGGGALYKSAGSLIYVSQGAIDASSRVLAVRVGGRAAFLPMVGPNEPSPA